jgi:ADP-ribosylation factor GTPase-activating protein 2/3
VVTDVSDDKSGDTNTPAGEPSDDFFSSWDKPTIKRPSNPPSRTGTPANRTASPFLAPGQNGNGAARPKSPLNAASPPDSSAPAASARTVTSSAAIRKAGASTGARKTNILGGKKSKLGVKKVPADVDLDFEEAEKKAREEAERIKELGYDPNDPEAVAEAAKKAAAAEAEAKRIAQPTPVSPGADGAAANMERTSAEMERLGMGVRRLGFGQVKSTAPATKSAGRLGFGSTSRSAAAAQGRLSLLERSMLMLTTMRTEDSNRYAREKFGTQKGISSDEFFGRAAFDPSAQAEAKTRLNNFEGATSISSNAYFGRPEEDFPVEDYGDIETAAKDFVRRFGITAADDLENLTQLVGEGATKLQGAVRAYLNS